MVIEAQVIDYLSNNLNCPVYAEQPGDGGTEFVVVEKTGSSRVNYLDSAMIAVQSYSGRLADAAELNQVVKGLMLAMPHEVGAVSAVRLNSDYNFTDTSTKHYRYQAVFDITYYEV